MIGCRGQGAEDIINDGVDGLLVEPKNVGSLSSVLRELLSKPDWARNLGKEGQVRAAEFTWERNARSYKDLFERIISSRIPSGSSGTSQYWHQSI